MAGSNLGSEEQEELKPLAQAETQSFLVAQLASINTKIDRRNSYMAGHYPGGEPLPPGEGELMHTYQQEKTLIQHLIQACQEQPLVPVLRQHLKRAQQRAFELSEKRKNSEEARTKQWEAQVEWDMLNILVSEWIGWIGNRPTT
jgi:hypothetical protein